MSIPKFCSLRMSDSMIVAHLVLLHVSILIHPDRHALNFIDPRVFVTPASGMARYRDPVFRPFVRPYIRLSTFATTLV